MAIITEVRFGHEDGALADTLAALPDLTVSIVRETSTAPGQYVYVFRFDATDADEIRPVLADDHTVRTVTSVPSVPDRHLWGIEFTPETKLLGPEVTKEGGFVVDARSSLPGYTPRGWRERWFFPDPDGIHNVWQHARAESFEFDVLDHSRQLRSDATHVDQDPLTDHQRTALVTAYERGYFSEPRETSLVELAESLDISPSAVNGRIKRGLKALVGTTLTVDEPEDGASPSGGRDDAARRHGDAVRPRSNGGER